MLDSFYAKMIIDVVPPMMRYIKNEMRIQAKAELTVPQFRILARLSRSPATNSELAEWMGVSASTMTRMIDSLTNKDFVTRLKESKDRRQIKMSLTERGQTTFNRLRDAVQAKLAEKVSQLPLERKKSLEAGLIALRETFL